MRTGSQPLLSVLALEKPFFPDGIFVGNPKKANRSTGEKEAGKITLRWVAGEKFKTLPFSHPDSFSGLPFP
jgi:hypothetical protein